MGWTSWAKFYCQLDCNKYPNACINERLCMDQADRLGGYLYTRLISSSNFLKLFWHRLVLDRNFECVFSGDQNLIRFSRQNDEIFEIRFRILILFIVRNFDFEKVILTHRQSILRLKKPLYTRKKTNPRCFEKIRADFHPGDHDF